MGILRFVFRSKRVTVDSIFGAIAAYLLVAVIFGIIDMLLLHWDPASFLLPDAEPTKPGVLVVAGQFYVAAVVAMLVGRFISQAMEKDGR